MDGLKMLQKQELFAQVGPAQTACFAQIVMMEHGQTGKSFGGWDDVLDGKNGAFFAELLES